MNAQTTFNDNISVPVVVISAQEAINQGTSPWNLLNIVKWHEFQLKAFKHNGIDDRVEYHRSAIKLIKRTVQEMFILLKQRGEKINFPNFYYEKLQERLRKEKVAK